MNKEEDRLVWEGSKYGVFSVRSLYIVLEQGGEKTFPAKAIWNPWVPPKVCFFAWEASWGKFLTLDQLKRR